MSLLAYLVEYNRWCNFVGILVIFAIAWMFSKKRHAINYKLVVNGLLLQFAIGYAVLRTEIGQSCVEFVAKGVDSLYQFADKGSAFVFGNLAQADGAWGFIFGIKVLPIIIFFGALMALLFHWGIIQVVVLGLSYVVRPLLGTSGAETLCAVSNSFLGQTEAPLLVKNYLKTMTKSEMLVVMVSGMATISGAILAVFAAMGVPVQHLLTASMMAIPGSLVIAKILYPETEESTTAAGAHVAFEGETKNVFEAISNGTTDGLYLALNVGAMLISFLSLLALLNALLIGASDYVNIALEYAGIATRIPLLSLDVIFSYVFSPFGWLLGFRGQEAHEIGQLLGIKVTVNELIAYGNMLTMNLSERTAAIATYVLCGFSNFSCIGIQIGGIGALVPEKRAWLCELGLLTVLGGTLSNLLSAMIASLLL